MAMASATSPSPAETTQAPISSQIRAPLNWLARNIQADARSPRASSFGPSSARRRAASEEVSPS